MAGGGVFKIPLQEFALPGQEQSRRNRCLGDVNTEDCLLCGHALSQSRWLRGKAVMDAGMPYSFQALRLMSKPAFPPPPPGLSRD